MNNADKPIYPTKGATYRESGQPNRVDVEYRAKTFHKFGGLTKREYFAAIALQGMLSNPSNSNLDIYGVNTSGPLGFIATTNVVRDAINYADELLKQLES